MRLLGFENEQEASDFCQHYGFTVVDSDVILDRSEYLEPDAAWLPQRSVHLIESKRMISVGEVRYRGSYMSAHVLLNLLNELGKRDKMQGLPSILSLFRNEFNKFNKTRARILDSFYHMIRLL